MYIYVAVQPDLDKTPCKWQLQSLGLNRSLPVERILKTTRCFCEAYTGLPVVRATENQKALNCVVLKYSIPVSEEQQIKEKRETLASGLTS